MPEDTLISIVAQLQQEVETLGVRGVTVASAEQLNWFRHTRDRVAEMGAEFLASKLTALIDAIEEGKPGGSARLLDLLTSIRVFDRVLTLQTVGDSLQQLAEFSTAEDAE